ncbi:MAG TPA: ABC transporter permease [Planctomycetaceae bacterium]|jgi:putative ABC transport system permease protein|nr:ABC transporter permease [Planctomycetaceae bacterium]
MISPVTVRIAVRALAKNKMRAGLTVLGVVIGIAAVTTMVSVGQSASQLVQSQFASLGTNVIIVQPAVRRRSGVMQAQVTLTGRDSDAIAQDCPSILASSPLIGTTAQVIFGSANYSPKQIHGVNSDYLIVRNWPMEKGEFFADRDVHSANKVCVIGHTLIGKLFQTSDPLGQMVRIKNIPFRVIGVLAPKGANMVGDDQDSIVLIPVTTVRKRLEGSEFDNVSAILASARATSLMTQAQHEIEELLTERHRIQPGQQSDFEVENTTEIANIFGIVTGTLTLMLASIAGISLVVGGVGIMNIMLVSVTERTREIGIRMAVGATPGDILRQFLVEAMILSCVGGLIGFLLGVGASIGIVSVINAISAGQKWTHQVSFVAALLAFLFAAAVGIFFGFYPARRASQLDPIESLRYE